MGRNCLPIKFKNLPLKYPKITQEITYISVYFRPKSSSIAFASLSDTAFAEALSLPTAVI